MAAAMRLREAPRAMGGAKSSPRLSKGKLMPQKVTLSMTAATSRPRKEGTVTPRTGLFADTVKIDGTSSTATARSDGEDIS